jgi:hypothetical protein
MVFYQAALLAGYAYAHWGARRLTLTAQLATHGLLLALAMLFLPIVLPADPHPPDAGGISPAFWLFGFLVGTAGLPFLVVASTAPLLQRWFSLSGHRDARDPYFLYAASNAGSLVGLLSYPWIVEPNIALTRQSQLWGIGFLAFAAQVACCGALIARRGSCRRQFPLMAPSAGESPAPRWHDVAWWVLLAFVPSSWMLGVTTYVTTDLAAIPMLWTIPLGLYLLTYILAFSRGFGDWTGISAAVFLLLVVPVILSLSAGFVHLFWIPLHLLVFFTGALVCHGRLAASRPGAQNLTAFYLSIALGGVLGGAFNALMAPSIFDRLAEYPLAVVLACLVAPAVAPPKEARAARSRQLDLVLPAIVLGLTAILVTRPREAMDSAPGMVGSMIVSGLGLYACVTGLRRPLRFALTAAAVLAASSLAPSPGGRLIHRERDFFGELRVLHDPRTQVHRFLHGSTLHGQQSLDPSARREPSTYFSRSGPIGDVFSVLDSRLKAHSGTRIAIVGLGAGTLACYAQPGQSWTFYEIDPAVARIAEDSRFFTYLSDARDRGVALDFVIGDARMRLREAQEYSYQLIVLDAFSSDVIPVHLLTREAIQLYRSRLAEGGLLAFHLSNRYLDLDSVLGRQARDAGLFCRIRYDLDITADEKQAGKQASVWALMATREAHLGAVADDPRWQVSQDHTDIRVWTDDDSDLPSHLVLGQRRFPVATTVSPAMPSISSAPSEP